MFNRIAFFKHTRELVWTILLCGALHGEILCSLPSHWIDPASRVGLAVLHATGTHRTSIMSLILMCGLPASGKTTIVDKLRELYETDGRTVRIIRDNDAAIQTSINTTSSSSQNDSESTPTSNRQSLYHSSTTEKQVRAQLRSNSDRALAVSQTIVIVDSLNYIKGFRYELFCVAKTAGVSYAVIEAEANVADCHKRDSARLESSKDGYGEGLIKALSDRFEPPKARNRWDSPLYTINTADSDWTDRLSETYSSLRAGKRLYATMATRQFTTPQVDTLAEIDRATRAAEASLIAHVQGGAAVGDALAIPGTSVKIRLQRKPRVAELRDMRRAYLNFSRMHPPKTPSTDKFLEEYVQYINEQLRTR